MNPQLAYRMAQFHQQDLYRKSEQARAAREGLSPSRFSALRDRIASVRSIHREPRAQPPARRPVAGGVGDIYVGDIYVGDIYVGDIYVGDI